MNYHYTNRLALGTAQLGMKYGINNQLGLPSEEAALEILAAAFRAGVRAIDTAGTYGTSQILLGKFAGKSELQIYSKFRNSDGYGGFADSVHRALDELRIPRLAGIWLHEFKDLQQFPELRGEAQALKAAGRIGQLGVSVYTDAQIATACTDDAIDCIQMPFNIFDNWTFRGEAIQRAKDAKKKIFVRSVYLQGLLLMEKVPDYLSALQAPLDRARLVAKSQGVPFCDFCLLYPFQFPEIDFVIVGCESLTQLEQNLASLASDRQPNYAELREVLIRDRDLLNPVTWRVS